MDALDILNREGSGRLRLAMVALFLVLSLAGGFALYQKLSGPKVAVPENAGTLYTCGMHPQVIQSEPGLCPICNMELTPMKPAAHAGHDHGAEHSPAESAEGEDETDSSSMEPAPAASSLAVRVAPAVIQKMGLRTAVVEKGTISRTIRAVSHIGFNEKAETVINARINGWAEVVHADFEGQRISRGQPLVGIYSPELVATQEEYLQLLRQLPLAGPEGKAELRELIRAARQRLRYWNVSEGQIRRLERTRKASRLLTLYSPYSGVVVKKNIVKGARVTEGMDLLRISDLSTVWAFIHIPEKEIPFIEMGMPVRMEIPQIPGREFRGEISFIFPYMDSKARDLKVRASFANPDLELKPGMYANLHLEKTLEEEHLLIPSSAILRTGKHDIAFVSKGQGVFEPRELKLGITDGDDRVQVLAGLQEEEAVVVSGQFLLDSESRIQEAVRKLRAGRGSGGAAEPANASPAESHEAPSGAPMPGGHQH